MKHPRSDVLRLAATVLQNDFRRTIVRDVIASTLRKLADDLDARVRS